MPAMRCCHSAGPVTCTLVPFESTATVTGMSLHLELVDGFHAEVLEGQQARAANRLRDQIRRAADGHQIDRAEFANGFDGLRAALGLAHHAEQAGFSEHLARELVHARGRCGAGGANNFVAYRIDRADVIDEAVAEDRRGAFRRGSACRSCACARRRGR